MLRGESGRQRKELAKLLATRAQERSLDKTVDSPFALLAKDNDIMWGGGRPDDITVIVSTVVDTTEHESPAHFAAFSGPGPPPEIEIRPDASKEEPIIHGGDWE